MVSGLGINPLLQRQIGFPDGLGVQVVPGPHGEGLQGFFGLGRGVLYFIYIIIISLFVYFSVIFDEYLSYFTCLKNQFQ